MKPKWLVYKPIKWRDDQTVCWQITHNGKIIAHLNSELEEEAERYAHFIWDCIHHCVSNKVEFSSGW